MLLKRSVLKGVSRRGSQQLLIPSKLYHHVPDKTLAASQLSSGTSGRITEPNAEGAILHSISSSNALESPATGETSGEQELPQIGAERGRVQNPVALLKSKYSTLSQIQTLSRSPVTGETSREQELPQIGSEHGRVQNPTTEELILCRLNLKRSPHCTLPVFSNGRVGLLNRLLKRLCYMGTSGAEPVIDCCVSSS